MGDNREGYVKGVLEFVGSGQERLCFGVVPGSPPGRTSSDADLYARVTL
jgi:hypothetical protein